MLHEKKNLAYLKKAYDPKKTWKELFLNIDENMKLISKENRDDKIEFSVKETKEKK